MGINFIYIIIHHTHTKDNQLNIVQYGLYSWLHMQTQLHKWLTLQYLSTAHSWTVS